jgi:AAA domain/Phage integrase family
VLRSEGLDASSIARLLAEFDRKVAESKAPMQPGSVLLIDEAGMVDSATLSRLIDHAQVADAKLVLIGDPAQLGEIEAGGLFAAIANRSESVVLDEVIRHRHELDREGAKRIREGEGREALDTVPLLGVLRARLDLRGLATASDLVFKRDRGGAPFDPKTINDRAKRAWATTNEREVELAEREGREPDLLQPITLHECRHTFASLLIDAGVNPKAIQEFMGHATIEETFSRYGHLMPGTRNQARELVDAYMDAAAA